MILKGSQRGSGQNLAAHLMRVDDNEHVRVHELRGFASDNLADAFKEAEAISRGTKCRQYLFSLSLSPPEDARVSAEEYLATIDTIERRLGLEGQPRAIVFHEKEGRAHAHCVWSRIDAQTMTARPLSFFKTKLTNISRDLYLDHGWKMPQGFIDSAKRDPMNFTLAEWQQAKRQGVDPRWTRQVVQDCWRRSDSRRAFERALQEHGMFLARGDKRGFVVLDHEGTVQSLPRLLDAKTKDVCARLGEGEGVKGVAETREEIAGRMTPAIRRHIADSRERFRKRSGDLGRHKEEVTRQHRAAREALAQRQKVEWLEETKRRNERFSKGLRGLWHRVTGRHGDIRRHNEAEAKASASRQTQERQRLIDQQRDQRAVLQERIKALRKEQAQQLLDLRSHVGFYLRLSRDREDAPEHVPSRTRTRPRRLER